jgi:hypothetical protein
MRPLDREAILEGIKTYQTAINEEWNESKLDEHLMSVGLCLFYENIDVDFRAYWNKMYPNKASLGVYPMQYNRDNKIKGYRFHYPFQIRVDYLTELLNKFP